MQAFFERGGPGYLVDNATSACEYCAYRVGDQFYGGLELSFDNRWRDLGILIAFIGSNLIFLFLGVRSFPSSSPSRYIKYTYANITSRDI
jgi:ATP-binding cassette subfamily G (WHITE) protein 2 (SNQ2)